MNDRRATDDRQGMSAAPGHLNSSPDMLATAIAVPPNGRIVVIRLDNIGDVVMTLPLVRELKRRFAGAAIDVVVSPVAADLFRHCPYTGRVIPLLSRRLPRFDVLDQLRRSRRLNREWFAASRPDLAISPRFGPEEGGTAFAAFASRARYRLAYRVLRPMMQRAARLLARYSHITWALADQAMVSGINFLTGILLAYIQPGPLTTRLIDWAEANFEV